MDAQLQLLFHADYVKFALIREFGDWRREFNRLREALTFAKGEGARELPFFVVDAGELFSESVITVEPKNRNSMIQDAEELAAFINTTLKVRKRCRVFSDVLHRCWNQPESRQQNSIQEFAKEHGWAVSIHEPAGYGIVADFTMPSEP